MTTKRFPVYKDLINLILLYIVVISFDMILSSSMDMLISVTEYAAIGAILLFTYLLREYIRRMYIYAILHAALLLVCFWLPLETADKVKIFAVALLFCVYDVFFWFNNADSSSDIHWGLGSVVLVSFIFCSGGRNIDYSVKVYYMGIVFAALIMLRMLISNFYELSRSGQLTDDMPVKELFKNNAIIAILIILTSVGLMIFVRADRLITGINTIVYRVLKVIINFILKFFADPGEDKVTLDWFNGLNFENMPEADEGSFLVQLVRIIEALVTILFFVVFAVLIIKLVITIVRVLTGKRDLRIRGYKTYIVKNEVRERLSSDEIKVKKSRVGFKTPLEKIRHIYRKELIKLKRSGAFVSMTKTPEENSKAVYDAKGRDIRIPTQIYEKVRYNTDYEVTQQDVTDLKRSFKANI